MADQNADDILIHEREILLQAEIRELSKRVDALIECAERLDESQQENKKLDYNGNKDKSGSSEDGFSSFEIRSSETFGSAWVKVSDEDDDVKDKSKKVESNEKLDLFGASLSFGNIPEVATEVVESQKKISLLQWD